MIVFTRLVLIALFVHTCSAVNGRYFPRFHLSPPEGWMNDPNGFCIFRNEYHMFYQYNPITSQEAGIAHWGHAKSSDLFHWEHLPIAMYPDETYDKTGVFSGSAIIENDMMYLLYTGNVNHPGEDPDHTQRQALAYSTDGVTVTKFLGNPVIKGEEYQPNIRDPKVWKHGEDTFYMVLGNSFNNDTLGRVLLFSSNDLIIWNQKSILGESNGSLGYMWECPDFFELDGKYVLLFSPQGIEPEGDNYRNLYQTGYIVGDFDYHSGEFTPITEFKELDHGHDFYATQSMLDKFNRRLVMAWFDMWEQVYPERNDGWTGQMTIPRELSLSQDYRLIQKPVKEVTDIRGRKLCSGEASNGHSVKLEDKAGEIQVRASNSQDFELLIESGNVTVTITYDYQNGTVTLDRGGEDGVRRTKWRPDGDIFWKIFLDASSIELFCGEGEVTFSSRYFPPTDVCVKLGNYAAKELSVFEILRTVTVPGEY